MRESSDFEKQAEEKRQYNGRPGERLSAAGTVDTARDGEHARKVRRAKKGD